MFGLNDTEEYSEYLTKAEREKMKKLLEKQEEDDREDMSLFALHFFDD